MTNKDFLSQFSDENKKPDSFKEEERVLIKKEREPLKPIYIIVPLIIILVILAIIYLLFFRAGIKVENFEGSSVSDAQSWIKQQGIETQGIVFKEEYNFDVESGVVISQTPNSGKVKKDSKFNFVVSGGPDPDEKISVPNLDSMNKAEIEDWISRNKLLNTKISIAYSDDVEEGAVISKTFTGCDEDSFKRGSTLKISISKGKKPAETVTMGNFVDKYYNEIETFANTNKLKIEKVETYSSTVDAGKIISHTPKEKEKIEQGSTITVYVSKGEANFMPDLVGKAWEYQLTGAKVTEVYSSVTKGNVISQSPKAGTALEADTKIEVVVSLGNTIDGSEFNTRTISELRDKIDSFNSKGADLDLHVHSEQQTSYDLYKNEISSIKISSGSVYCSLNGPIPIDAYVDVVICGGHIYEVDASEFVVDEATGEFETVKLIDELYRMGIPFNNKSTKDTCFLYIDDVLVTSKKFEYIEGQYMFLALGNDLAANNSESEETTGQ